MDYNAIVRRTIQRLQRELGRQPSENEVNYALEQDAIEASRGNAPPVRNFNANLRAAEEASRREAEEAAAKKEENELRAVLEATRREEEARRRAQEEANMKAVLEANRPEEEEQKAVLKTLLTIPDPTMRTATLYFVELEALQRSHPEWINTHNQQWQLIIDIVNILQPMLQSDVPLDVKYIAKIPLLLITKIYGPTGINRTEFLSGNKSYQEMKRVRNEADAANAAKVKSEANEEARRKGEIEEGLKKLALQRKEEEVAELKTAMNTAEKAYTNNSSLMKGNPRAKQRLNTAKAAYEKAKKELEELAKLKGGKKTKGAKATRKLKKKKTRSSK
jgi:hypothetical protein